MTYLTNTLPATANPGADLHAAIAATLTAAGYTLVDTQVISTRTHKVWKSPAGGNSAGLDWFLDISYPTTGAGNMTLLPFEFYDPATHLAYRGVNVHSNNTVDAATGTYTGAAGAALESVTSGLTGATAAAQQQLVLSTSSFGYAFSITGDRVAAIVSTAPTLLLYVGLYKPTTQYAANAGAKLFPLILVNVMGGNQSSALGTTPYATSGGSAASASAALTRIAPRTSVVGSWASHCVVAPALANMASLPPVPTGDTTISPFSTSDVNVMGGASGVGFYGSLIGIVAIAAAATVSRFDTGTLGPDTYVFTSFAANMAYGLKAA